MPSGEMTAQGGRLLNGWPPQASAAAVAVTVAANSSAWLRLPQPGSVRYIVMLFDVAVQKLATKIASVA
jgi:hypothetical protein